MFSWGSNPRWWLLRLFIRHKTASFIIVENVRVGIVLRFAQLLVFTYMSWSVLGNRSYFHNEVPSGGSNMWITGYNPSQGELPAFCDNPELDYIYDESFTFTNNSCREFAYGEILDKLPSGGLFIMTYSQETSRVSTDCDVSFRQCTSKEAKTRNNFVVGVDDIVVSLNHAMATSFRTDHDPALDLIDSDGNILKSFGAGEVVSVSLSEMFQAAAISGLDATNHGASIATSVGTPIYRLTGARIRFRFTYLNEGSWNGKEVRARLRIVVDQTGWGGRGPQFDYTHEMIDAETGLRSFRALDNYAYGIFITAEVVGSIGTPDFVTAVNALVTYSVMFALAGYIADLAAEMTPEVSAVFRQRKRAYLESPQSATRKKLSRVSLGSLTEHLKVAPKPAPLDTASPIISKAEEVVKKDVNMAQQKDDQALDKKGRFCASC
ncbi:P2X receptor E [Hondaea fermentalgiana]|uniref:P2X receptor E n=1 Tax=Hondaea fermentalgiana TaxID=2315210 RepID=A0A2R5GAL0_9STRA|nr:P2X receptor E [Hondaea fermentalgiana]|eukprot:GBG27635.1 P2X receptor E [Hondaea fermentalgiana]